MSELSLKELAAETLMDKHRRLAQAKCEHKEIYYSTVSGQNGTFGNGFCWNCGKSFRNADTSLRITRCLEH